MATKKPQAPYLTDTRNTLDFDAGQAWLDAQKGADDQEQAPQQAGVLRTAGDVGIKLAQGAVDLGQSLVGLGSLATGGAVGQGMRMMGYDPDATNAALGEYLSPSQQAADAKVQAADGFVDSAIASVQNPRSILGGIAQSAPGMLAGMGLTSAVARGIGLRAALASTEGRLAAQLATDAGKPAAEAAAAALKTAGGKAAADAAIKDASTRLLATSAGTEGAQSAGQIADQAQAKGRNWSEYALPAAGAGVLTAGIGLGAGRLMGDAATDIASGSRTLKGSLPAKIGKEAFSEGVLEEAPQSGQEQYLTNVATGEPDRMKGVGNAAGSGMIVGGIMGAGMAGMHGSDKPAPAQAAQPGAAPATPATPAAPAAPPAPPPPLPANAGPLQRAQHAAATVAAGAAATTRAAQQAEVQRQVDAANGFDRQAAAAPAAPASAPAAAPGNTDPAAGRATKQAEVRRQIDAANAPLQAPRDPFADVNGQAAAAADDQAENGIPSGAPNPGSEHPVAVASNLANHAAREQYYDQHIGAVDDLAAQRADEQAVYPEQQAAAAARKQRQAEEAQAREAADRTRQQQRAEARDASAAQRARAEQDTYLRMQHLKREAELEAVQGRAEARQAMKSRNTRMDMLDQVLAEKADATAASKLRAFSDRLRREGYRNIAPTEDEIGHANRHTDAATAFSKPYEAPSAPNELVDAVPERKAAPTPAGVNTAAVDAAIAAGMRLKTANGSVLHKKGSSKVFKLSSAQKAYYLQRMAAQEGKQAAAEGAADEVPAAAEAGSGQTAAPAMDAEAGADAPKEHADTHAVRAAPVDSPLVAVRDLRGVTHYVREYELQNPNRTLLRRHHKNGTPIQGEGKTRLHRGNIDADGSGATETWKDVPYFTAANDQPFATAAAAAAGVKRYGQDPADFEFQQVNGGFAAVRKTLLETKGQPTQAPEAAGVNGSAADHAGHQIDKEWTAFAPDSGTLGIPRADMPQIKSEHRGPLTQFLLGLKPPITHENDIVESDTLKPTQREFSPAKVEKAKNHEGDDRAILVSSDGYILDGHHQWLAKLEQDKPVRVIRFDAPIRELIDAVKGFPSAGVSEGAKAPAESSQAAPAQAGEALAPRNGEQGQVSQTAPAAVKLSIGKLPNSAEPITVRDGVVHIGSYPAQDFDSGEDVTVAQDASPQEIKAALVKAGAVARGNKIFGMPKDVPAEAHAAPAPAPAPAPEAAPAKAEAAPQAAAPAAPAVDPLDAELQAALGHFADVAADVFGAKLNATGQKHTAGELLPALSKIVELLVRKGFRSFNAAIGNAAKAMRANPQAAAYVDQISARQWKAAYQAVAEYHDGTDSEDSVAAMTADQVLQLVAPATDVNTSAAPQEATAPPAQNGTPEPTGETMAKEAPAAQDESPAAADEPALTKQQLIEKTSSTPHANQVEPDRSPFEMEVETISGPATVKVDSGRLDNRNYVGIRMSGEQYGQVNGVPLSLGLVYLPHGEQLTRENMEKRVRQLIDVMEANQRDYGRYHEGRSLYEPVGSREYERQWQGFLSRGKQPGTPYEYMQSDVDQKWKAPREVWAERIAAGYTKLKPGIGPDMLTNPAGNEHLYWVTTDYVDLVKELLAEHRKQQRKGKATEGEESAPELTKQQLNKLSVKDMTDAQLLRARDELPKRAEPVAKEMQRRGLDKTPESVAEPAPAIDLGRTASASKLRSENEQTMQQAGAEAFASGAERAPPGWMSGQSRALWLAGYDAAKAEQPAATEAPAAQPAPATEVAAPEGEPKPFRPFTEAEKQAIARMSFGAGREVNEAFNMGIPGVIRPNTIKVVRERLLKMDPDKVLPYIAATVESIEQDKAEEQAPEQGPVAGPASEQPAVPLLAGEALAEKAAEHWAGMSHDARYSELLMQGIGDSDARHAMLTKWDDLGSSLRDGMAQRFARREGWNAAPAAEVPASTQPAEPSPPFKIGDQVHFSSGIYSNDNGKGASGIVESISAIGRMVVRAKNGAGFAVMPKDYGTLSAGEDSERAEPPAPPAPPTVKARQPNGSDSKKAEALFKSPAPTQAPAPASNTFSEAPIDTYVVERAAMNSVKLRPLPFKQFSDTDSAALITWLKENGWGAFKEKNYVHGIGPNGATWDDVPQPVRVTKRGMAAHAKTEKHAAERDAVQAQRAADLARLGATAWINEVFGPDAMGDFNKAALARYLDGEAKKFDGLMNGKWLAGLSTLGISEDQAATLSTDDVIGKIKSAYGDRAKQEVAATAPASPVALEGSPEYAALDARPTTNDKMVDSLSDDQVRAMYAAMNLAGSKQSVDKLRDIIKAEHPDDVEAGLAAVLPQAAADAAAPAEHIEAGVAESATPTVITASLKKSADHTVMNNEEARADLLQKINAAIAAAGADTTTNAEDTELHAAGQALLKARGALAKAKAGIETAAAKASLAAAEQRAVAARKAAHFIVFDVPGDGKFTVANNKDNLTRFRDQVMATDGFKGRPRPQKSTSRLGTSPETAIHDMLEQGEQVAAHALAKEIGKPFRFTVNEKDGTPNLYTDARDVTDLPHGVTGYVGRLHGAKKAPWLFIEHKSGLAIGSGATSAAAALSVARSKLDTVSQDAIANGIQKMAAKAPDQAALETAWLARAEASDEAYTRQEEAKSDAAARKRAADAEQARQEAERKAAAIAARAMSPEGKAEAAGFTIKSNSMVVAKGQGFEVEYPGSRKIGQVSLQDKTKGTYQAFVGTVRSSPHLSMDEALAWLKQWYTDEARANAPAPAPAAPKTAEPTGPARSTIGQLAATLLHDIQDKDALATREDADRLRKRGMAIVEEIRGSSLPRNIGDMLVRDIDHIWDQRAVNHRKPSISEAGRAKALRDTLRQITDMAEKAAKPADAKPVIPEGYKPAGEPYYSNGVLTQGYAPFIDGDRVIDKDSRHHGVIDSMIGPGPIFAKAVVKFDNGMAVSVPFARMEAEQNEAATPAAPKIGDAATIAGVDMILADMREIDGVRYELYNANSLKDDRAVARMVDIDSGEVIHTIANKSYAAAEAGFKEDVRLATAAAAGQAPKGRTVTPYSLNALRNPVEHGDIVRLADGSEWEARQGYTGMGWSLVKDKQTHPLATNMDGQVNFIGGIIKADEEAKERVRRDTQAALGADGRIFGMRPEQIEGMQGGGMSDKGQWYDPEAKAKRDAEEVEDRRKLVEQQRAENAARVADAVTDPRIQALKDGGIHDSQLLQAARELEEGDDSLVKDLARIQGITLPEALGTGSTAAGMTSDTQDAPRLKNFGWDAVKLSDAYTLDQLAQLRHQVEAEHANPLDAQGHPLENGQSTIYLYDKKGRAKLDKLSWAVTYKLKEAREAEHQEGTAPAATADDKLTPDQAKTQMTWRDLGQRDGVTTHRLMFNEDGPGDGSGSITIANVQKFDGGKWEIDGERYDNLRDAKKAATEAGIAYLRREGYVAKEATPAALHEVARTAQHEEDKAEFAWDMLEQVSQTLTNDADVEKVQPLADQYKGAASEHRKAKEAAIKQMDPAGQKEFLAQQKGRADQDTAAVAATADSVRAEIEEALGRKLDTSGTAVATQATAAASPVAVFGPMNLAEHARTMQAIEDGELPLAAYKANYQRTLDSEDAIKAELNAKKKDDLLKLGGYSFVVRYKNDNKDRIVSSLYNDMLMEYVLNTGGMFSYGMDGPRPAIAKRVAAATADDLQEHAQSIRKARAEREAEREQRTAGMADPQTLDDFTAVLRAKMAEGVTFKDARLSLTPEQRAKFDDLVATKSRAERADRKVAQQEQTMRAPGEPLTASETIKTRHTKHGHDLWQFQLDQRTSTEDFKDLVAKARRLGGDYSSYRGNGAIPGWQFRTPEAAAAFKALIAGDASAAQDVLAARRDAFADDKSQSAADRLSEMADRLDQIADDSDGVERKSNTARRARFAAAADAASRNSRALATTMRNIAAAMKDGTAKFLDRVRTKTQLEQIRSTLSVAQYAALKAKYNDNFDFQRHKDDPITAVAADYAEWPTYTAFRSDLAALARQLLETEGTKKLGQSIMKVADDVSAAYLKFAKDKFHQVATFSNRTTGERPVFTSEKDAELAIARSGYRGKAIAYKVKARDYTIIMSPSEAIERGIWTGDGDKRITLHPDVGSEIVEKLGKLNRRNRNRANPPPSAPWQFDTAHDQLAKWARMGIESPAEMRAALREYIALREAPKEADKVKELERAMVGRRNDGLDFFPTPEGQAEEMIAVADIQPDMDVLEPSAGMGHIADRLRENGVEPDVVEMAGDRRELLEAKGYDLVGHDFMDLGSDKLYDRIIMNPPFSDRRDAAHVQHAYSLLKPGGRLVAIMGEGVFFGQDKKAQAFRDWLDQIGGTSEKLAEGTFMDPSLPVNTGVNARMVVVDKPAGDLVVGPDVMNSVRADPTDSAAFRDWFGDSKVVDDNGNPLVLYHGSIVRDSARAPGMGDIKAFDRLFTTKFRAHSIDTVGSWFSTNPGDGGAQTYSGTGNGSVIYPVYLSIKNPQVTTFQLLQRRARLLANGKDDGRMPGKAEVDAYRKWLKDMGKDGIKIEHDEYAENGSTEFKHQTAWIALEPEQVKSAIGNSGDFDPANRDILASRVAEVDQTRRQLLVAAAAAAIAPNAQAGDVKVGKARPIDPKVLSQRVAPGVEKVLRDGQAGGTTSMNGTEALRKAMKLIALTGPKEVRALAAQVEKLLPTTGRMLLTVDDTRRMNVHGVVSFSPVFHMQLFTAEGRTGLTYETLIHEAMHVAVAARYRALSEGMVRNNDRLLKVPAPQAARALEQFRQVWEEFGQATASEKFTDPLLKLAVEEASNNPDELFVRALTDPLLQAYMANKRYEGKTLWERFKDWVKRSLFGMGPESGTAPSWLDAALMASGDVVDAMGGDSADFARMKATSKYQNQAHNSRARIQEDSPEFKAWFGDSKVVNPDGSPRVVYHGTAHPDFTRNGKRIEFGTKNGMGEGAYFAPDPASASEYAKMDAEVGDGDPAVIPVYLSIQNPKAMYGIDSQSISPEQKAQLLAEGYDGVFGYGDGDGKLYEIAVFHPSQIKSAIGNNGDFDPGNPDIMMSRAVPDPAGAASTGLPATLANAVNDAKKLELWSGHQVGDLLDRTNQVSWWHKTLGTMDNLSRRYPAFRPVYQTVQKFIGDVSRYATSAAEMAPTLMPQLENLRDVVGKNRKKAVSAADTKAIAAPIFQGTLSWARDDNGRPVKVEELEAAAKDMTTNRKEMILVGQGVIDKETRDAWHALPPESHAAAVDAKYAETQLQAGVVWTDGELRSMFNLNDAQVDLYHEFRAAIDKSITNLTISEMVKMGGKTAKGLMDRAVAMPTLQSAARMIRDHYIALAKMHPDMANIYLATAKQVMNQADKGQRLMDRGYAPLTRFGKYTVYMEEQGEDPAFLMFEDAADAAKMARELREKNPGAFIRQGTLSEEEYKLFAGVSPETVELFGSMLGLGADKNASDAAYQEFLRLTKANRSALKRLIHRKGVAGYSEDAGRVLASFLYSNARLTSSNVHSGEIDEAVQAIPKEQGQLKDEAMGLRQHIRDPQGGGTFLSGMMFAQFLGGSVASAVVNLTQPITMTLPFLSQYGGLVKAGKRLKSAMSEAAAKNIDDAELAQALKDAAAVVAPQEVHAMQAQAAGNATLIAGDGTKMGDARAKAHNAMAAVRLGWGKLFAMAELSNRKITFIAAWRTAREEGLPNATAFAIDAVNRTQQVYNQGNKPRWARNPVGGLLLTFKQYSVGYLELLSQMAFAGKPGSPERKAGQRAALYMLAVLFMMGGADGLPFEQDLEDAIDGILQRLGYNFSTKRAKQAFLADALGEGGADIVLKGLSALPGMPVDVAGRFGMGNLIPGTGLLTKKDSYTRDLGELAGPAGDLAKRAFTGAGKLLGGDLVGAALDISPASVRNLKQGVDMLRTGTYRDARGYIVNHTNPLEAGMKMVGFQPNSTADIQDAKGQALNMIGQARMRSGEISERWAQGRANGDEAMVQEAREMRDDWNRKNPETPVKISMPGVMHRVRAMREDALARTQKTAGKALKQAVRRELAEVRD